MDRCMGFHTLEELKDYEREKNVWHLPRIRKLTTQTIKPM